MRKIGTAVLCCLGVAAIGGSVAQADNASNPNWVAAHQCTTDLHAMGVKSFKALYGDSAPKYKHAMRNCQRQHGKSAHNVVKNAAQECKAEQADPNFAADHGMTFDQFYGTNANDKNSFGKCVSSKVRSTEAQDDQNVQNAAQQCRAERNDPGFAGNHGGESFTDFYGSNKNKKNAFGKCVSQKAKAQNNS